MKIAVSCLAILAATVPALSSAAAQAVSRLSVAQLSELIALIRAKGEGVVIYPQVLEALGLSGQKYNAPLKQLTILQHSTGISHGILMLPNSDGYILIRGPDSTESDNYRVDINFNLVAAARAVGHGDIAAMSPQTKADELRQEVQFWARAADTLTTASPMSMRRSPPEAVPGHGRLETASERLSF